MSLSQSTSALSAFVPRWADWGPARQNPRRDLLAGLTVAVVALPLALAFGIASGLGPAAGIATAVVAGALAAIFGGSNLQVSGPTGAMAVVLAPIVAKYGAGAVLTVGLLAGIVLIGLAFVGAGRSARYIPLPVIEGFTIGIAVIITLQQIPTALGVTSTGGKVGAAAVRAVQDWLATATSSPAAWAAPLIAAAVAAAILIAARLRPAWPVSLLAVAAAAVTVAITGLSVATIGHLPSGLPAPSLPSFTGDLSQLILPAVAVAALAALESLLCASVADAMSVGETHDPDRELFGQGIANLITPLFGGIPATAAIARTAVNVRTGARSRLAALTHSVVLLLVVVAFAPAVSAIPLAALSGVLIATAVQMIEVSSTTALLRSTRADAIVLVITAATTILLDLVTAVIIGLLVAGTLALHQVAQHARIDEVPLDHDDHNTEERQLLDQHIVAYRFDGALFFGAAHRFLLELSEVGDVRVVILRMSRITTLDATGASVTADIIKRLEHRGITVLLSGIQPDHERVLDQLGVYQELASERHVFDHTPQAIAHARLHVDREAH